MFKKKKKRHLCTNPAVGTVCVKRVGWCSRENVRRKKSEGTHFLQQE